MNYDLPRPKPLHPESVLITSKLIVGNRLTRFWLHDYRAGNAALRLVRMDILEGNHRIDVLRKRGVDADKLVREIVAKTEL
jgi:hypothetical protein